MFGCLVQLELEKTYDKQNPAYSDIIWKQFKNQYFVTLPAVVEEFHPGACYRKSSPYSDDKGTRNHTVGDMHYWAVWQGLKPLSEFNHERSRFFSEYGFSHSRNSSRSNGMHLYQRIGI